jgi:hypothetical protein
MRLIARGSACAPVILRKRHGGSAGAVHVVISATKTRRKQVHKPLKLGVDVVKIDTVHEK